MTLAATADRPRVLPAADLAALFDVLRDDGWPVVGPTVADGTIVYDATERRGRLAAPPDMKTRPRPLAGARPRPVA